MNNFFIAVNIDKDPGFVKTREIQDYLIKAGKKCEYVGVKRKYEESELEGNILSSMPEDTDCVMALGGDGTMIQVADALSGKSIPMIGINMGHLGFLAEVAIDQVNTVLDRLIKDEFDIEERMMLSGSTYIAGKKNIIGDALNDIVITRLGSLRIINFKIYVNNKLLNNYNADGIIVSTPTGSTGYNLSAGGPIVEPEAELILLTPICPHTLNARAIILSDRDDIRIEMGATRHINTDEVDVSFDGSRNMILQNGDYVSIKKSENKTKIIKLSKESFLEILSRKMTE